MCRLPKKIQHIEDSCDYYKIQNKNNNKTRSEIYKATLAVKNVTIKFIIDTDSPNTIILQQQPKSSTRQHFWSWSNPNQMPTHATQQDWITVTNKSHAEKKRRNTWVVSEMYWNWTSQGDPLRFFIHATANHQKIEGGTFCDFFSKKSQCRKNWRGAFSPVQLCMLC